MTTTIRLAIALAVVAVIVLLFGPAACNKMASLSLKGRVAQGQLDAKGNSAVDAVTVITNVGKQEAEAKDLTRTNAEEIRNAQDADTRAPDAHAAFLRAVCRRPSHRDSERCRLLNPPSP